MNQLAVEDRYLHRIAARAAKTVQTRAMKDPEFAALALRGLLGPTGTVNFDQVTKTKTVEKIITGANPETLEQIVPLFESLIANPGGEDSKVVASSRQHLVGLLHLIVKSQSSVANPVVPDTLERSIEKILLVLARFSYFISDVVTDRRPLASSPPFTQASREFFRNRIMSCLNILINGRKDAASFPYTVVRSIHQMADAAEQGKFVIEMSDSVRESVDSVFKILKKITHKVNFTV
jgi:DNA polymerase phi